MSAAVRLDAVCDLTMGQAPIGASYNGEGQGLPLIAGAGDFGDAHPVVKKFTTDPGKVCAAGDIVLGIRASIGEKVVADREYCLGRGVAGLRARAGLEQRYLWHWLTHVTPLLSAKAKGATFKQVNREDISELTIAVPPLPEQRRIADILDKADALRAKRRAALAQIDTLTQSIFLDMFGDPATNPKGLRKAALGDLIRLKSGDFLPASEMATGGAFPVLGGNGVNGYHDRYLFEERQIVIGRVGVYCGCVHVAPPKSWITDNALYVSECALGLRFEYLFHALTHAHLNQYASQSGQPLISGSRVYPVTILVPPEDLQISFEERIASVKAVEQACITGRSRFDDLFASLQHRAFRGEL